MSQTINDENREHCKRIAEDLEAYVNGSIYRTEDGEEINIDELTEDEQEAITETGEQLGLWDYFADALDVKYVVDSDRVTVTSVKVCVTCGGPNIYIDTETGNIELYWWGERASYPLDRETIGAVDEWAQELFNC